MGIESAAGNFREALVAPLFWYVPFGFPGLLLYKAVDAMDSMIGCRTAGPRHYAGETGTDSWIGGGSARATHRDIRRTLYLYVCACLINGAWVAAIAVIRFSPAG